MPVCPFQRLPYRFMLTLLLSLHFGCAASPQAQDSYASTGLDYLIVNGLPDYKDRYSSVVHVLPGSGTCSGVLIKPQLVLTAAHCFCPLAHLTPGQTYRPSRQRASSSPNEAKPICSERAEVIGVLYSPDNEDQGPSLRIETRQGAVRLHEEYEFGTDAAGYLTVSSIVISMGRDGLFSFRGPGADNQGAHAWKGDSGGPCFREDAAGNRLLAGIISTGRITPQGRMTHFTSAFHHRAWIKAQMDLSEKEGSNKKDATR